MWILHHKLPSVKKETAIECVDEKCEVLNQADLEPNDYEF